jgi:hypothetical protein
MANPTDQKYKKANNEESNEIKTWRPVSYERADAPLTMWKAAQEYELKFHTRFDSLTYFPKELLIKLHSVESDISKLPSNVTIASYSDPTILDAMRVLEQVANTKTPSVGQRQDYFSALKRIYRKLPSRPDEAAQDEHALFVGIEREGRILAKSMGWLPRTHSFHPEAKRIPFEEGLLIGLSEVPPLREYDRCFVIDGAIASGATIITVIEKLRLFTSSFNVFSIHSPYEGLQSLTRYGSAQGLDLRITVGHATRGINDHYYAIDPVDPSRVIVGDLGDTISDLQR